MQITERLRGESLMKNFLQKMDRFGAMQWIILIVAVLLVPHTHGISEYAGLIIIASLSMVLYARWRRKGLFAHRR